MLRMPKQSDKPPPKPAELTISDEPGMAERFQRGLQRALNTPAKPRIKPTPKIEIVDYET
jgi:hypothetical protein